MSSTSQDSAHHFFAEAHHLTSEAKFTITALPNAEIRAVEALVHKLYAVRRILSDLDDPYSDPVELQSLVDYVESCICPLQEFLESPPPPPSTNIPKTHTGRRGRPSYDLDLDRAILLHNLGLAWNAIATAMGCDRKTLYNHMVAAGLTEATNNPHTSISDEELDEKIRLIAEEHPFIGSAIALGHLRSRWGVHIPIRRVQDSFRRVDQLGVLLR